MTTTRLDLTRDQILGFRLRAGALDTRLPPGPGSLRRAAWAGLQDSMPRAALLSIHARIADTRPDAWEDASLVQLWGPRFCAYVVAAADLPLFTLGRLPDGTAARGLASDLAQRVRGFLDGRRMPYGEVARGMGEPPNRLRYAAPTGTVLIRWDGARQPIVWSVDPPRMDSPEARTELARRYLHVFGPGTAAAFARWAGIGSAEGRKAFDALAGSLVPVRTPVGDGWALAGDEKALRLGADASVPARLLPSGDAYFLLQRADRELLVPDAGLRPRLWTERVWPGAILVGGEIVGTWRRAHADVTLEPWRRLSPAERWAVEAEASSLPLPGLPREIRARWAA